MTNRSRRHVILDKSQYAIEDGTIEDSTYIITIPRNDNDRNDNDNNDNDNEDDPMIMDTQCITPYTKNDICNCCNDDLFEDYKSLNIDENSPQQEIDDYIEPHTILNYLSESIISEIFQYVDQFDLINLLLVNKFFYKLALERLYKRVTIILNSDFPIKYKNDRKSYIKENGIKFMDSALIISTRNLLKFLNSLNKNKYLIEQIKYLIFDKCFSQSETSENSKNELSFQKLLLKNQKNFNEEELKFIQNFIIELFGENSNKLSFLHITFVDFIEGIKKYTNFLSRSNVRNRIFKLFVTNLKSLYYPKKPQSLTNLFVMLDEVELMSIKEIDLNHEPFNLFNSLFTLTCSTNNQFGLEILNKFKLINNDSKLNLKGLTIFHCHKETLNDEINDYSDLNLKLNFEILNSKINLTFLKHLYLKIDCNEHRNNNCKCFPNFFKDLTNFSNNNNGLPNLISFELELFPNLEWLRPHQILENILTPLGNFITSLNNLSRLTIDFSTPGFKMFDDSMGMTSSILNRLNERLMEAFFLCFLSSNNGKIIQNLQTLQLPDFLTSFIYYKPNFFESLLHTCKCWGCQLVLEKLKVLFYPLNKDDVEDDDDEDINNEMDLQSTYYLLIGFILGKLQADREVCVPIKQKTYNFAQYPIYKGQPHTLHYHFHKNKQCKCLIEEDLNGEDQFNIDNLVTTYIIHQLKPIINYLSIIFYKLETLMIHGIYYENVDNKGLLPIFDQDIYPNEFLNQKLFEINSNLIPNVPFGKFNK